MQKLPLMMAFLFFMVSTSATLSCANDLGTAEEQFRKRMDIKYTLKNLGKETQANSNGLESFEKASNNKEMPWLSLLLNPPSILPDGPKAYIIVVQVL